MTVTRNVIYDLLPAYFAGEVSADTRTLVDEFLESDPELRRMADRFRERLQDAPVSIFLTPATIASELCFSGRRHVSSCGRRRWHGPSARRSASGWRFSPVCEVHWGC